MHTRRATVLAVCTAIVLGAMALAATADAAESIAFIRGGNIWVMDFDGQHQRAVTTSADCASPSWSPEGSKLVYVRGDGFRKKSLWILDVAAGTASQFTSRLSDYICPRWSPDGKRIACFLYDTSPHIATEYTPSRLVVMDAQTRRATVLKRGIFGAQSLAWCPDSSQIAYSSAAEGKASISVIAASDGRNVRNDLYKVSHDTPEVVVGSLDWRVADRIAFWDYVHAEPAAAKSAVRQVTLSGGVTTLHEEEDAAPDCFAWSVSAAKDGSLVIGTRAGVGILKEGQITSLADKAADACCQ